MQPNFNTIDKLTTGSVIMILLMKAAELFKKQMKYSDRSSETIKGYMIELNQFNTFLTKKYNGPVYIEEVAVQDLEDYIGMLKEKGNAPASRSRSIYILRAFTNFCLQNRPLSHVQSASYCRFCTYSRETFPSHPAPCS